MALSWLLLFMCILHVTLARVYIVDQKNVVNGKRLGTLQQPFAKIADCIAALNIAGDECHIREGRYHEEIKIENLHGTEQKPFVIRGYGNERPLLDGTVILKNLTEWKKNGNIYSAKVSDKIWQLFFDDLMMTNARWPNAKWSDKTIFHGTRWPGLANTSKSGHFVNLDNSLKDTKINMNGALAIMNIGSFETFVAKVYGHAANKNDFKFLDTFGDYHFNYERSRYFLEDKLELLDAPEEWFFDKSNNMLYVYPAKDEHPYESVLRGKVQSYAFTVINSIHVTFKNLDFFATAIKADVTHIKFRTSDLTFDSLNFRFHTYSKRMLGEISLIDWMDINGIYSKGKPETWGKFTFFNNTFYGSDGLALSYWGRNVTIKNNFFEYNDWSAANMVKAGGGLGTIKSFGVYDLFERNTLQYNGASVGIRPALKPTVRLNDVSKQCWGLIQNDGSGVQLTRKPQVNSIVEQNWVHDQPKYGLRFDGEPPKLGTYGTIKNNVVYKCNGIMAKGEYHTVTNNIAFEKVNAKDDDKQGAGCALCVLKYVRRNPVSINHHTVVCNNLADVGNGGKIVNGKGAVWPVQGKVCPNNVFDANVNNELMDPHNNDFRPQKGSQAAKLNLGPYKYNPDMTQYWIPGRKVYKPSSPVPPTGSTSVRAINRNALMWLNALNCRRHHVYFADVNGNDEADLKYIGSTDGEDNVVYLKSRVARRRAYKWRVDAEECGDGGKYTGDVWKFTTE